MYIILITDDTNQFILRKDITKVWQQSILHSTKCYLCDNKGSTKVVNLDQCFNADTLIFLIVNN